MRLERNYPSTIPGQLTLSALNVSRRELTGPKKEGSGGRLIENQKGEGDSDRARVRARVRMEWRKRPVRITAKDVFVFVGRIIMIPPEFCSTGGSARMVKVPRI